MRNTLYFLIERINISVFLLHKLLSFTISNLRLDVHYFRRQNVLDSGRHIGGSGNELRLRSLIDQTERLVGRDLRQNKDGLIGQYQL